MGGRMTYFELKHVERLARIAGQFDDEPRPLAPVRWGPASWWRIGLVVMALLILVVALWPSFS